MTQYWWLVQYGTTFTSNNSSLVQMYQNLVWLDFSVVQSFLKLCTEYGSDTVVFCAKIQRVVATLSSGSSLPRAYEISQWGIVMHICINKLGPNWISWWSVVILAPNNYLNQWRFIVSSKGKNAFLWDFKQNSEFSSQEYEYENTARKMSAIFSGLSVLNLSRREPWVGFLTFADSPASLHSAGVTMVYPRVVIRNKKCLQ